VKRGKEVFNMPLIRWRPFGELESLRREMDRLWDRFYRVLPPTEARERGWEPSLDLSETKESFLLKAELPGMDPKELDISLSGDVLSVRGEKREEKKEEGESYHVVERRYGTFSRLLRLPAGVESDKISAEYKNGVLSITLPKSPEAKEKEIKIKVGE